MEGGPTVVLARIEQGVTVQLIGGDVEPAALGIQFDAIRPAEQPVVLGEDAIARGEARPMALLAMSVT